MRHTVLRLIDANTNRAREALRVVEDYARFVLNDAALSASLKEVRHLLAGAVGALQREAMLHRDTPGDVGTTHSVPTELQRQDLAHVVTAGGKRAGEALRAIEEYLKTLDPQAASKVESARYAFYEIERRIALTLRDTKRFETVRLCVLITESCCGQVGWLDATRRAIAGGADCLQLREKDMDGGEFLCRAREFVRVCHDAGVMSIINDRVDVTLLSNADGVHVGQGDVPAVDARKVLGPDKIVGVSTHDLGQARQARRDGADYIGVGPIFRSPTKPRGWDVLPGLAFAKQVADEFADFPAFAIAGITGGNVDEVLRSGLTRIAVTSAVTGARDIEQATRELKRALTGEREPLENAV